MPKYKAYVPRTQRSKAIEKKTDVVSSIDTTLPGYVEFQITPEKLNLMDDYKGNISFEPVSPHHNCHTSRQCRDNVTAVHRKPLKNIETFGLSLFELEKGESVIAQSVHLLQSDPHRKMSMQSITANADARDATLLFISHLLIRTTTSP